MVLTKKLEISKMKEKITICYKKEVLVMTINNRKFEIMLAERGLSMNELAKKANLSRQRVNVILNSKKITPVVAGKLARALDVSVEEIIE